VVAWVAVWEWVVDVWEAGVWEVAVWAAEVECWGVGWEVDEIWEDVVAERLINGMCQFYCCSVLIERLYGYMIEIITV
jgi:hypothetical protein